MAVAMRFELMEDRAFLGLPSALRWFYTSLCLEMLEASHTSKKMTFEHITRITGFEHQEINGAISHLKAVGLLKTGGKGELLIPRAELHFVRFQAKPVGEQRKTKDDCAEVFEHWKKVFGSKGRLTTKREQKIRARLRDGYKVETLKEAIDGCKLSPFHMGENSNGRRYNDLELICRNPEKVEMFLEHSRAGKQIHSEREQATNRLQSRAQLIENIRSKGDEDGWVEG